MNVTAARQAGTVSRVEVTGLEPIRDHERHGNPRSLFGIWASTNLTLGAFVSGALGIQLGLSLWQAAVGMVIGILFGSVLIPAMSFIGCRLGIAQMLMTRPVFGRVGAIVPAAIAWLNFLGWFTILDVLGANALHTAFGLPIVPGLVLLSIVTIVIAFIGHDMVHIAERWIAIVVGIVFVVLACQSFAKVNWSYAGDPAVHGAARWGLFGLVLAISFSYAGPGYTPYASDYTRYLPLKTRFREIFIPSFTGMAVSTSFAFLLGAIMTTIDTRADSTTLIGQVAGPFKIPAMVALALGTVGANVMNVYSGGLTGLISGIRVPRWASVLLIGVIGTALACWFRLNFVSNYEEYLLLVLYAIPAMDALFLVDFYLVRRGRYDVRVFQGRQAGRRGVNVRGYIAYLIGVAVCIPLMSSALYTGPVAKWLNGADISYVVSMVVAGAVYYGLCRVRVFGEEPLLGPAASTEPAVDAPVAAASAG
jgi:NCS1 family nucleobase:cation symporter-1